MRRLFSYSSSKLLCIIFLLAILIRFWHFPQNVYFGYDQARDAFESQAIYKNIDFKIVGPSTASPGLFHGPAYWYLVGPWYLLGQGNPEFPAGFLLFFNAVGVLLVYWVGKILFNARTALVAALLYAFSFEETQYAMYFGNPAPAVLTIFLLYGGLSWTVFKKDWRGIPLALLGLGLSIQFEFFLVYLSVILLVLMLIFYKTWVGLITPVRFLVSIVVFVFSILTFILADFKFGFRTVKSLVGTLQNGGHDLQLIKVAAAIIERIRLEVHDNIFSFNPQLELVLFLLLITAVFYLSLAGKKDSPKLLFLVVWCMGSSLMYLFGIPNLYYSNIGTAAGLILLVAYFLEVVWRKNRQMSLLLLVLVLASNIYLIKSQNYKGIINGIYVQEGMLLSREKQALDFIYSESGDKPIVVAAMTMPLKINTTWAYLFNWYGKEKYERVPYWAGEVAPGYPGSLAYWQSQEKEYAFFSIIEPTRGVREAFVENFLEDQRQYGDVALEKRYGDSLQTQLIAQKRVPQNTQ